MFNNNNICKCNICLPSSQKQKIKSTNKANLKFILPIRKLALSLPQISNKGCLKTWAEIIPKNLIRVMPA